MDKEKQREQARLRVQRYRDKQKALHSDSVTSPSVTGQDRGTTVEMFEGKPRYLVLSDGQVLDRANQPSPNKHLPAMIACNRANDYRCKMSRQEQLGRLLISLNKEITGLDGKRVSLLSMVRYGIGGITFKEIKNAIK